MSVNLLCTVHGTFLWFDEGLNRLRHGIGLDVPRNAGLIARDGNYYPVRMIGGEWVELRGLTGSGTIGRGGEASVPLAFRPHRLADNTIALEANGLFLCAEPDGLVTLSRQTHAVWESFALVSEGDLDFLRDIGARQWYSATASGVLPKPWLELDADFKCRVGVSSITLSSLLAARQTWNGKTLSFLYDGWKIEHLTCFHPLIYLIAYGQQEIFDCLAVTLQSLHECGQYTGEVAIITDRSMDQMRGIIPAAMDRRVRLIDMPALDTLDITACKYRITEVAGIEVFRPLLYLDADVVCNQPVHDLLVELLLQNRISVPLERELPGEHGFYGSALFQADQTAQLRDVKGASAGLFGLPNIDLARTYFPVILDSLYMLSRLLGTRVPSLRYDQPTLNYALHKMNIGEYETLTRRVVTPFDASRPLETIPRLGFAHFSGGSGISGPKPPLMRAYMDMLRLGA